MQNNYKNTELGLIPKEWEVRELREVGVFYSGGTPSTTNPNYYGGQIPFIKSGEINSKKTEQYLTNEGLNNSSAKMVDIGDILYALYGATSGEVAICKIKGAINQAILCIKFKQNSIFLLNFLIHNKQNILSTFLQGGQGNLSAEIVKSFKIPLPPLAEQEKIAKILSTWDMAIEKITTLIEKKKLRKKALMQAIFIQKIRFKDEKGIDFPEWEVKKLGEVAKFSKGKGISKNDIEEDGATECIRYGELYTKYNERITEIFSKTNVDVKDLVLSEYNDIIIPSSGETQIDIATASCVLKSGVALGGDLNIMKTQENGVFMAYYLNNARKQEIAALAQGNSVVHLYSRQLQNLEIEIPTLAEQEKIANVLSLADSEIEDLEKQKNLLKTQKQGIMQVLLTGKVRVKI